MSRFSMEIPRVELVRTVDSLLSWARAAKVLDDAAWHRKEDEELPLVSCRR